MRGKPDLSRLVGGIWYSPSEAAVLLGAVEGLRAGIAARASGEATDEALLSVLGYTAERLSLQLAALSWPRDASGKAPYPV
jgi:hypothetical protein